MDEFSELAECMTLGSLLDAVRERYRDFELVEHWKQGEFHHDVVIELSVEHGTPCQFLVISTNCNGGVKEVLGFDVCPSRWALWHERCPENPDFEGELPTIRGLARTQHCGSTPVNCFQLTRGASFVRSSGSDSVEVAGRATRST